jgi:hypothetical protein
MQIPVAATGHCPRSMMIASSRMRTWRSERSALAVIGVRGASAWVDTVSSVTNLQQGKRRPANGP